MQQKFCYLWFLMHQYKYGGYFFLYSCLFYPVLKLLKVEDLLVINHS